MSTPSDAARPAGPPQAAFSSSIDAEKISEPPCAMPVSMIRSGCTDQISSCIATMSCGYWMIGRPSHEKLYEYFGGDRRAHEAVRRRLQRLVGAVGGDALGHFRVEFAHGHVPLDRQAVEAVRGQLPGSRRR